MGRNKEIIFFKKRNKWNKEQKGTKKQKATWQTVITLNVIDTQSERQRWSDWIKK